MINKSPSVPDNVHQINGITYEVEHNFSNKVSLLELLCKEIISASKHPEIIDQQVS